MSDYIIVDGELYHHGIKGQKWGVRRFQNPDGSYTDAGKRRNLKALKRIRENPRHNLGLAVGTKHDKGNVITSAADKVRSLAREAQIANERHIDAVSRIESEIRSNDRRFYTDNGRSMSKKEYDKMQRDTLRKHKKELDTLEKEANETESRHKAAVKQVVDEYLGEYGDVTIQTIHGKKRKTESTAGEAMTVEILWGNELRKDPIRADEEEPQPSSVKSSVLAGLYAATGSKVIAKALDKSNDEDAKRWAKTKRKS